MTLPLLIVSLLIIAFGTLSAFLFLRRQQTLQLTVREQAREKMLEHWAAQELARAH